MNILGLLGQWLGRALVARGLGAPQRGAAPVAKPRITALLFAVPAADVQLTTCPLADGALEALPAADVALTTQPESATLPG